MSRRGILGAIGREQVKGCEKRGELERGEAGRGAPDLDCMQWYDIGVQGMLAVGKKTRLPLNLRQAFHTP